MLESIIYVICDSGGVSGTLAAASADFWAAVCPLHCPRDSAHQSADHAKKRR
jgi:hypothetical protein